MLYIYILYEGHLGHSKKDLIDLVHTLWLIHMYVLIQSFDALSYILQLRL